MARRSFLVLPALAAAIVAWAVLGGNPERVRYAQVLGGPTREGSTLAILVRALEQGDDDRPVPIAALGLQVTARAGSTAALARGTTDAAGQLELRLEFGLAPPEDPWLNVEALAPVAGRPLARGVVALDVERWRAGARRDGGWLPGQPTGELHVRVAPESGAFAVPFAGQLVLQVLAPRAAAQREGDRTSGDPAPVPGALASVELDGAETAAPVDPQMAPTDAMGLTRVGLRPLEHAVSARVLVRAGERRGQWYGALPVVPGAIVAELSGAALALRSPIPRERAFLGIVSARERIAGAIVPLVIAEDGSASGRFELDPELAARLAAEPTWAVVSSEYDKRSPAVVGWPLHPAFDPSAPPLTFGVPDQVLLDGRSGALFDVQRRDRERRSTAAAALAAVGALLGAAFWSEVRRGRRRTAVARRTGSDRDERPASTPAGWLLGVALGCIALGFGALAYFGWLAH